MDEKGKRVGVIHQMQHEGKNLEIASKGTQVALSIKGPTIGRQINEGDIFYTDLNGPMNGCNPSRKPLPFLSIHGYSDKTVKYKGGQGDGGLLPAIPDWYAHNS